jgi:hypothetical protein
VVTTVAGHTAEIIAWLGPHAAVSLERDPFASERVAMVSVVDVAPTAGIPRENREIRFVRERSIQFVCTQALADSERVTTSKNRLVQLFPVKN